MIGFNLFALRVNEYNTSLPELRFVTSSFSSSALSFRVSVTALIRVIRFNSLNDFSPNLVSSKNISKLY